MVAGLIVICAIFGIPYYWTVRWNSQGSNIQPEQPIKHTAPLSPELKRLPPVAESNPTLALFSTYKDTGNIEALDEVLADEPSSISRVETLEEAVKSEADILILLMERFDEKSVNASTIDFLKSRKVIGIGYGAAELFGKLGLEINAGACAHSTISAPAIKLEPSKIMRQWRSGETLTAFDLSSREVDVDFNFAMYIPKKSPLRSVVDVIAGWKGVENYAPIVRHGNYILSGLAAPASTWTPEYKSYFRNLVSALHARGLEPFKRAKWATTDPGTYKLKLAGGHSTNELSEWTYYFQFTKATTFSAKVEFEGSNSLTMLFMGEGMQHWVRKDIRRGETGEISVRITEKDIEALGDGYWKLMLNNFDMGNSADCTLEIEYAREAGPGERPLIAPRQLSPENKAVFNHYPRETTLRWAPVPGAIGYILETDCYHCCESNRWCSDVKGQGYLTTVYTTSFTYNFVGAQPGRWRVWAIGENGQEGPKSDWREFRYTR
jgi:hypothetical protein